MPDTNTSPVAESAQGFNTGEPQPATCSPQPETGESCSPSSIRDPESSIQDHVPRRLGETPRAFSAFMTWFQLGHARSHQAVADKLGEGLPTVKNWASKYDWSERLQRFNSGLLQKQAADLAERERKLAADWAARLNRFREQEWNGAQKLLCVAECFLENFGDEDLSKMTLSHASRALRISSEIGRSALAGADLPPSSDPVMSPIQQQMLDALRRLSAGNQSSSSSSSSSSNPAATTGASTPSQNSFSRETTTIEPGVLPAGPSKLSETT